MVRQNCKEWQSGDAHVLGFWGFWFFQMPSKDREQTTGTEKVQEKYRGRRKRGERRGKKMTAKHRNRNKEASRHQSRHN